MTDELRIEHKKITDLKPDPANANAGTERGLRALDDSLAEVGLGRSVLVDKNGYLIAGNKTVERSVDRGFEDAIVVHTRGDKLVVVQRDDLDLTSADDFKARKLAYYDNRVGQLDLEWNVDQVLSDLQSGVDLGNLFDVDAIFDALNAVEPELPADADQEAPALLNRWDVPDAIFSSDNDYEIPTLDIHLQATTLDLPFVVWGTQSISRPVPKGTLCFYVEDYRFEALWSDPSNIVNTRASALMEPNFSCYPSMPVAVGAYQIYRKRWIARWCQTHGMKVFVDLNVAPKWRDINMKGVPQGWSAYCTRGAHDAIDELDEEFALACDRAGKDNPLFVVYGGGDSTRDVCKQRGWLWLDNQKRRLNGTITEMNNGE
jgi:hypothetical protein